MNEPRRPAAVVLTINVRPPHGVIFVERGHHLRSHPGQIGLPGGGMDALDEGDLQSTALRELEEEVGIAAADVRVVGRLRSIRARVNRYVVTPFVAVVADVPLRLDLSELTGAFTVPLQRVLDDLVDGTYAFGTIEVETPLLVYGERTIWGLTGHVLRDFVDAWNAQDGEMRERIESLLGGWPGKDAV